MSMGPQTLAQILASQWRWDEVAGRQDVFNQLIEINSAGVTMKKEIKRHKTKQERDALHKPQPDYIEGRRGEECRSACSLDVSDLIKKVL